jgi:hypothetical protein
VSWGNWRGTMGKPHPTTGTLESQFFKRPKRRDGAARFREHWRFIGGDWPQVARSSLYPFLYPARLKTGPKPAKRVLFELDVGNRKPLKDRLSLNSPS